MDERIAGIVNSIGAGLSAEQKNVLATIMERGAIALIPVGEVSEISENMGVFRVGKIIALSSGSETNVDGTGCFVSATGEEFSDGTILNVGTCKEGAYAAGFNTDGDLVAAGGEYVINEDGTFSNGLTFLHRFEAIYGGVRRTAFLGMFLPEGETLPAFRLYFSAPAESNLFANGSFESGDLTSWTDTNTTWAAEEDTEYGYCATHDDTADGCPPTLTQSIAVSGGLLYDFEFASKVNSGYFIPYVKLVWKDAGSTILRTDVIQGNGSNSWVEKGGVYTSPSTAATVLVEVYPGEIFTSASVTGFGLVAVTSFASIDLKDSKIIANAYPGKPANLLGLPQSNMVFAEQFVYSATVAYALTTSQRHGYYRGPSAANANDGDTIDITFHVAAGTYTLNILGVTEGGSGKVDGYWDDSASAAWTGDDFYTGAASYNASFTHSVTFTTGGRHKLRLKVNGKNAGSSDYKVWLTAAWLVPTAYTVEAD